MVVGRGARLVTTFRFAVHSTPCPRGKVKPILGEAVDPPGSPISEVARQVSSESLHRGASAVAPPTMSQPISSLRRGTVPDMHSLPRLITAVAAAALTLTACTEPATDRASSSAPSAEYEERAAPEDIAADIRSIEERFDARVGVSLLDTETGQTISYRGSERFGFASTLKVFAVAEFLRRTSADERDEIVRWTEFDIDRAGYSPATTEALDTGLTAAELAEAAVRDSDNTATNLILDRIGGPSGLDAALEELGDDITEVVDIEPDLNTVAPGSTANTTTADAFTASLAAIRRDDFSTESDRAILIDWMSGNATGDLLVRAGAPDGWVVADKSGGAGPIRNDIAIVTPPGRSPILVTVLTEKNDPSAPFDNAVVSDTAAAVLGALE